MNLLSIAWTFAIAIALSGAGAQPATAASADWPQFRGPNRDGKSLESGLLKQWPENGPKLLWTVSGVGKGFSHVSVAGGLVYVTGLIEKDGVLQAYTLDGKLKWKASYGPEYAEGHPGARTIPTVFDGRIYVISALGRLSCFDAADGKLQWAVETFEKYEAQPIQWGFSESPLIDGNHVIVTPCGNKATMVALDRKTGKEVWASQSLGHAASFCSAVLVEHKGVRMIVTMTEKAVVAFAPEDGKLLWQHAYENARQNHPDTPIYSDGMLYVTSGYGKGAIGLKLADDGRSVQQVWEQRKQDPAHGQAVLVDGYVYASSHQSGSGKWSCVELKTGRLAWLEKCVGQGGSIIHADGLLYCYSESGVVGLVRPNPEKCEVVSTFKVPAGDGSHWAHPVVADGKLFIRHGDAVMCYDVRQP